MDFKRPRQKFTFTGMQVSRPVDLLDDGKLALAKNVRQFTQGILESRPGLLAVSTGVLAAPAHSVRRLNDPILATFARLVGAAAKLFSGQTTFTQIDDGFSSAPLSVIPFAPERSPQPFTCIADALR